MTVSLTDLIAQKEALERQIREAQSNAKAEAISRVRQLMAAHGLTPADLGTMPSKKGGGPNAGTKLPPKYRDPLSGATWTGRGLKPKWLSSAIEGGRSLNDFAI